MSHLQADIEELISDYIKNSEEDVDRSELRERILETTFPEICKSVLDSLLKTAPGMLRDRRADELQFREKNYKKWSTAFDLTEMYLKMSQEFGQAMSDELRNAAEESNDYRFVAIRSLHARALLVANEIVCLMKGGFADGALGRWRTLHEISVVAKLLSQENIVISERYLKHRNARMYKDLKSYKEHQEEAKLVPLNEKTLQDAEQVYNYVLEKYGDEMKYDWGWASPALGKRKPNFCQIEEYVGMARWRPRYKWSSEDTHGGYRPHMRMLGTSEAQQPMLLVGPSDSGLADPGQMVTVSLDVVNAALYTLSPDIVDFVVYRKIMDWLLDQISLAFVKVHKRTNTEAKH